MAGIRFPGLGSNIDFGSIVQQLVALEQRNIQNQRSRQSSLQLKSDAWKDISSRLDTLKSAVSDLRLASTLGARKVESSNEAVVTATASSQAVAATYSIQVESLASSHKVQARSFNSSTTDLASLGVTTFGDITVGQKADGSDATFTVSASDSLTTLAQKINDNSATVKATVIKYGDGDYRLQLSTINSGTANKFSTTPGNAQLLSDGTTTVLKDLEILNPDDTFNTTRESGGTDAIFYLDGGITPITRSTNVISDVIDGVTFTLKKTSTSDGNPAPGGLEETSITVSADRDQALEKIKAFVEAYNSAYTFIESKVSKDPLTDLIGPLSGDSSAKRILLELRRNVTSPVVGMTGSIQSLADIGIQTGKWDSATKNQLELNETKLTEALENDIDAVMQLFGAERINVAAGATVVASGTDGGSYDPDWVVNGNSNETDFGLVGGGWKSDTLPASLQLTFAQSATVDQLVLYTLSSGGTASDFKVYAGADATGTLLADVTGNTSGTVTLDFDAITTNQIYIEFTGSGDGRANVLEVEVNQQNFGVASKLYDLITDVNKSDGTADAARDRIAKDIEAIDTRIKRMETRLAEQEERLYAQFARLDRMLASINRQGAALMQMLQ